jgi:hypothetical protein
VADSPALLYSIVGVALLATIGLAVSNQGVRLSGLAALLAGLTAMMWAPSVFDGRGTTGVFVTDAGTEWRAYPAARRFVEIVRDYDSPQSRVYTWYSGTKGPTNIGWTTLPQEGQTVQLLGVSAPLNRLDPLGRARLLQPQAAYVMAISGKPSQLLGAEHALEASGFRDELVKRGALASSGLRYRLMHLTKKP